MRFQPLIPWWLVIPLLLAGLGAIGWQIYNRRKQGRQILLTWIRRAVMVFLLGILLLGPSIPGGTSSPGVANLDVLFAVDTTASMGAEDYAGTQLRLTGVKQDMLDISAKLKGAHFGVITFDSKANTVLPFTADGGTFTAAVQTMNREIFGTSKGSAIDEPIELVAQQLKNSKATHPERSRMLFYLGDGEQTTDAKIETFEPIAQYISGGGVLGYGTTEGAKIQKYTALTDSNTEPSYINTPDPNTKEFVPAVSKLDETNLNKIAEELKVTYQNRNDGGTFNDMLKVSNAEVLIEKGRKITHYVNLYWLFAIPFVGLIFWEWRTMVLLLFELRKGQKENHV